MHGACTCVQVAGACRDLAACTAVSVPCRCLVSASPSAVPQLVQLAAACNRSRPHVRVLLDALAVIGVLARDARCRGRVCGVAACVDMLAGQLQAFREHEVGARLTDVAEWMVCFDLSWMVMQRLWTRLG